MKKFIYALLALPTLLFASCEAEMGSEPGTDSKPAVTVYTYDVAAPNNPDTDVRVRFATNSAARQLYYLVEPANEANAEIEAKGEEAYAQKVIEKGVKVDVKGAEIIDVILTDLKDKTFNITAVAVNGGHSPLAIESFGIPWKQIKTGVMVYDKDLYTFLPVKEVQCVLEQAETDETLFRVKNAFGEGKNIKFRKLVGKGGMSGSDPFTFLSVVGKQQTGWKVKLSSGDVYDLWVTDIATWKKKEDFLESTTYGCVMFDNSLDLIFNFCWQVDAGTLKYATMGSGSSYFVPDGQ